MKVLYLGRAVDSEHFRAMVYGHNDKKLLVNSWEEYQDAISSGIWFPSKESIKAIVNKRKKKDADSAAVCPTSIPAD